MTKLRLMLAVGLAAATLGLFLAVIAMGGALRAGLAPWPGIAVVVMATAAFVLSGKQGRSWWRACWRQAVRSAWCTAS